MVRLNLVLHAPKHEGLEIEHAFRVLRRGVRVLPWCLDCQVWTREDEDDPGRLHVYYIEQWEDEQAMEDRVRSDAFTSVLEVLEAAAECPRVEFDFVSRHEGLEYVENVRRAHQS